MSSADCITKSATNEKFISEMKELTRVVLSNWQSYCKGQGHEKVQVSSKWAVALGLPAAKNF